METKYKVFKWSFNFLLVIFLTLYFSQLTGYYEYQNYQKMIMTEEQIKQFEQDIKDGKEVSLLNRLEGDLSESKVIEKFKKMGFIEE